MTRAGVSVAVCVVGAACGTASAVVTERISFEPCRAVVALDGTASVETRSYDDALRRLRQHFATISERARICEWTLVVFREDARYAAEEWTFEYPVYELSVCEEPTLSEAARLFRAQREYELERAKKDCQHSQATTIEGFRATRDSVVAEIEKQLRVPELATDGCTAFWGMLRRLSETPDLRLAIVLTDGVDSCVKRPDRIDAPFDADVVLVLLRRAETTDHDPWKDFDRRDAWVSETASWVNVIAPYEFYPSRFELRVDEEPEARAEVW